MEQDAILREIVKQAKSLNPLDSASYSAYKYVKLNQELLGYVRDTCPDIHKPSEKLVAITPINKKKIVRKSKSVKKLVNKKVRKTTGKVFKTVEYMWKPTGRTFTLVGNVCPLTRIAAATIVPPRELIPIVQIKRKVWKPTGTVFKSVGYIWKPTGWTFTLVGNVFPLTRIATATIVPPREPIPIVKAWINQLLHWIATPTIVPPKEPIPIVNKTDKPVVTLVVQIVLWYLDSGCSKYITGDRSQLVNFVQKFLGTVKFGNDHVAKIMGYEDYQIGNVIISWVYYVEGLGHNLFSGLVRGLPKLKFEKDHLCSACAMGKSTRKTHKPKSEDTNQEKLYLLHMDLCGSMCVESVNGKKYILVIVDDYSLFTWVRLKVPVRLARSPQQNGVVERRNRTLIEAARTILIYDQAPLFLWAEAVATACFTQNCSIIRLRHRKTLYELLHNKLPDLSFFHVFGALCYPTNDSENLDKLQPKADIGIFIGYAPTKKAF
nr:hypothetical protein [Tanacetum cinerariifolium]